MRRGRFLRGAVLGAAFSLGLVLLPGCDGDIIDQEEPQPISLELFGVPQIQYNSDDGTTTVVVQFIARDYRNVPLDADDLDVTMSVDRRAIDVEGILQQDSEALTSNVHLTMVLDASYSMLQHQPPAFLPMLSAARRAINSGRTLYLDRPGQFEWDFYWFNDVIYTPVESGQDFIWHESDIERIAAPDAGTFTKLYSAVKVAVDNSILHAETNGSGPRDQHIVVAFSDGADNYSWFGNSEIAGSGSISANRQYRYFGSEPVTRQNIENLLDQHPEVQLHVMGLGSQVNDSELSAMARAGSGRYFKNPSSQVDQLFDQVILELTSVQTQGVTIPIQPGDYTFRVAVDQVDGQGEGVYEFRFRGGDEDAGVR